MFSCRAVIIKNSQPLRDGWYVCYYLGKTDFTLFWLTERQFGGKKINKNSALGGYDSSHCLVSCF